MEGKGNEVVKEVERRLELNVILRYHSDLES